MQGRSWLFLVELASILLPVFAETGYFYFQYYSAEDCSGNAEYSEGFLANYCFVTESGPYGSKSFMLTGLEAACDSMQINYFSDTDCQFATNAVLDPVFSICSSDSETSYAGYCSIGSSLPVSVSSVVASYQNNTESCGTPSTIHFQAFAVGACLMYGSRYSVSYDCDFAQETKYSTDPSCSGTSTVDTYSEGCYAAGHTINLQIPSFQQTLIYNETINASAASYQCIVQEITPTPIPASYIPQLPTSQYDALSDMYTSLNGEYWDWKTPYDTYGIPWNFTDGSNPCYDGWQGVHCARVSTTDEGDTFDVIGFLLQQYGLEGTIPDSIEDFRSLELIAFANNLITGSLPDSISSLPLLLSMYLDNNRLTGTIPEGFGHFPLLKTMEIWFNFLTGTIPPSVGNLDQLVEFALDDNFLTGPIPNEIGNMSKLDYVSLKSNQLTGTLPASLGNLQRLTSLYLLPTNVSGTIPEALCAITSLLYFELGSINLVGSIPDCWENMGELLSFDIGGAPYLTGPVPASLGSVTSLESLSIEGTGITGSIPESIGNLDRMQDLYFYSNPSLTGPIPDAIQYMTQLAFFGVMLNSLSGTLPAALCQCTLLVELYLYNNQFTGTIPSCLGTELPLLFVLAADTNHFTGTLPATLGTEISKAEFNFNHLTGGISREFCLASTALSEFSITYNHMNGSLPEEIGSMSALHYLGLSNNNFTGTLPASLYSLTMETLLLDYNAFTGNISDSILNFQALNVLALNNNDFTGTIVSDLLTLPILTICAMGGNYFTGSLPGRQDGQIINNALASLELSENQLTGTIPDSYCTFLDLTNLDLGNNLLFGPVPECLFNLTFLIGFDLAYNSLSGHISPLICDKFFLHNFIINNNAMTGNIPACITQLYSLNELLLEYNLFSGTIPQTIGNFQNLTYLGLQFNNIYGSIPASLVEMASMTTLDVSNNQISGTLPANIGNLRSVVYFSIGNNQLSGTLPPSLSQLTELLILFAGGNLFTGPLSGVFDSQYQVSLATVDVSSNQLSGTLPSELFNIQSLQNFAAVSNCFTGSIPQSICNASGLLVLALDGMTSASECQNPLFDNRFGTYQWESTVTSGIPSCVFTDLSFLQTLHLSGNGITGSLPDNIVLGASLRDLSLSNNRMTGTIPAAFQAHVWSNFDLSYNKFTGLLDSNGIEVEHINSSSVSLEVNRLSGRIPSDMTDLQDITVLNGNMFSCDYQKSSLPSHDSDYDQYTCGSNSFDWSIYFWIAVTAVAGCCVVLLFAVKTAWLQERKQRVLDCIAEFTQTKEPSFQPLQQYGAFVKYRGAMMVAAIALILMALYAILTFLHHTYAYEYAWSISAAYLSGTAVAIVLIIVYAVLIGLDFYLLEQLPSPAGAAAGGAQQGMERFSKSSQDTSSTAAATAREEHLSTAQIATLIVLFMVNFSVTAVINALYVYIVINFSDSVNTLAQLAIALYKLLWNRFAIPSLMSFVGGGDLGLEDGPATSPVAGFLLQFQFVMELFNNIVAPCLATAIISSDCFYNVFVTPAEVSASYSFAICNDIRVVTSNCIEYGSVTSNTSYVPPFEYSYQCSSELVTNYASVFVYVFAFTAFGKPLLCIVLENLRFYAQEEEASCCMRWLGSLAVILPEINRNPGGVVPKERLFDKPRFVLGLYTHIAVMATFGVIFPPLQIVIYVSLVSTAYYNEFLIGRYQLEFREEEKLPRLLRKLGREFDAMFTNRSPLVFIIYFAALFYSLFIFDTMGDQRGWRIALAAMVIMVCIPLLMHGITWMAKKWQRRRAVGMERGSDARSSTQSASITHSTDGIVRNFLTENPIFGASTSGKVRNSEDGRTSLAKIDEAAGAHEEISWKKEKGRVSKGTALPVHKNSRSIDAEL